MRSFKAARIHDTEHTCDISRIWIWKLSIGTEGLVNHEPDLLKHFQGVFSTNPHKCFYRKLVGYGNAGTCEQYTQTTPGHGFGVPQRAKFTNPAVYPEIAYNVMNP